MNYCSICNAEIKRKNYQGSKRMYCSKEHQIIGSNKYPHKKLKGINVNCKRCNKEYYISKSFIGKRKYCSYECVNEDKKKRVNKNCETCNKLYVVRLSQIRWRGSKYCSANCKQIGASKKIGDKSVNWKGGVSFVYNKIRKGIEWKRWRRSVFERDDYTCKRCGIRSAKGMKVELHPHHIKQYAYYPELRFDISNGLTLCAECHRKEPHEIRRK